MPENNIYYKCYYHLFNSVTAQIEGLEAMERHRALHDEELSRIIAALKRAQCEAEELFIHKPCD